MMPGFKGTNNVCYGGYLWRGLRFMQNHLVSLKQSGRVYPGTIEAKHVPYGD